MVQESIKIQTRVTIEQLKLMVQFVLAEYPETKGNFTKMSIIITDNFNVLCLPVDLEQYYAMQNCGEDYELEERRLTHGIRM